MELFKLTGRKAIVTGSARGLGKAIAEGLHEAGAEVVLIDVLDETTQTAQEMGSSGEPVHAVQANLLDRAQLRSAYQQAVEHLGGSVDILVNNAGMHVRQPCIGFPEEGWDNVIELNLTSAFLLSQLAGETMLKQGKGRIINTASVIGLVGGLNATAYASSKGAIIQLTRSLSNEWASKGINVNAIAPGYMMTEMNADILAEGSRIASISERIPAGRWGNPSDLKGIAIFLASDASEYVSGAIIPVDGGFLGR